MIATEAAAEGINLQFCSLVINYDLPYSGGHNHCAPVGRAASRIST
jgi:superfamily II DNA/RNA helicase